MQKTLKSLIFEQKWVTENLGASSRFFYNFCAKPDFGQFLFKFEPPKYFVQKFNSAYQFCVEIKFSSIFFYKIAHLSDFYQFLCKIDCLSIFYKKFVFINFNTKI